MTSPSPTDMADADTMDNGVFLTRPRFWMAASWGSSRIISNERRSFEREIDWESAARAACAAGRFWRGARGGRGGHNTTRRRERGSMSTAVVVAPGATAAKAPAAMYADIMADIAYLTKTRVLPARVLVMRPCEHIGCRECPCAWKEMHRPWSCPMCGAPIAGTRRLERD